jgi:hypothetical protein
MATSEEICKEVEEFYKGRTRLPSVEKMLLRLENRLAVRVRGSAANKGSVNSRLKATFSVCWEIF